MNKISKNNKNPLILDIAPKNWQSSRVYYEPKLRKYVWAPEDPLNFHENYYPEQYALSNNTGQGQKRTDPFTPGTGEGPRSARLLGGKTFLPPCSGVFITGACSTGAHGHVKAIVCGREWCHVCGQKDSWSHNRRKAAWFGKILTFEKVGYLIVTVPEELRENFKSKQVLADFRTYIRRKLRREKLSGERGFHYERYEYKSKKTGKIRKGKRKVLHGYTNGFTRYHFAGDCQTCKGEGCELCIYTGAGREWKPHLNILLPEGWMKPELIEKFKNDVSAWFKQYFKLQTEPKGNVWYNYVTKNPQKIHKLNYVTRATWRFYDEHICSIIKGFRNSQSWGKFDVKKQVTTATAAGEKNICFHCLEETGEISKILWNRDEEGKIIKQRKKEIDLIIDNYRHTENGYYFKFNDIDEVMKN